ncbi:MAG: tRNA epoxyqueuosine(34) reductase QueG, partial [Bauldia sp.]
MAVPAAVKHRRAGDERIGAGGYAGGAGPGIDAAVDFEADRPAPAGPAVRIARYARGRDYHLELIDRLEELATFLRGRGATLTRCYADGGPVPERELASRAGLGWIGKNAMLIRPGAGSFVLIGSILTDLALPVDQPLDTDHCGSCTRCLDAFPTEAIVELRVVDATRCISYLTIEHEGAIPEDLRPAIGNRIFGCDDCQLVCPWNKFARRTDEPDFRARNGLDVATLPQLFAWNEDEFLRRAEGSAIRRSGHERWLRN